MEGSISELFSLSPGSVVALCGGGGAGSLLYRMADDAAARGLKVLCSRTVGGQRPPAAEGRTTVIAEGVADLEAHLRAAFDEGPQVVLFGAVERKDKLTGMGEETLGALHASGLADLLLIEADGARGRPFKAPREDEPLIPPFATHMVVVVGMEVVGRPLSPRYVHRPERVEALTGLAEGEIVTPEVVAGVVSTPEAYLSKAPPSARCFLCCDKANTPERRRSAVRIAELLADAPMRIVSLG